MRLLQALLDHIADRIDVTYCVMSQVGLPVEAVVQLVRRDYLVLSLPTQKHAIAFATASDFNLRLAEDQVSHMEVYP